MQITRQRMKPEMNINTSEVCPSCDGTGKISSTLVLEDEIEKNLSYLIMQKHTGLTIEVHPILICLSHQRISFQKNEMELEIQAKN